MSIWRRVRFFQAERITNQVPRLPAGYSRGWSRVSDPTFLCDGATTLRLGVLALALLAGPAHGEHVKQTIELGEMKLEVTWVRSNAEIEHARKRYGAETVDKGHRRVPQKPEGFAVLVSAEGELVCRLWILKPVNVDDERTTALGHELLHCLLGAYHR
jgi:hypothetical protein